MQTEKNSTNFWKEYRAYRAQRKQAEKEEKKLRREERKNLPADQRAANRKARAQVRKEQTVWKWEALSWVITLAGAVAVALLLRTFVAEPVRVDGDSMSNTLLDHEIVLESKLDYLFGDLQRNDVVICHYPGRGGTLFVKRLVALPGDTVEIRRLTSAEWTQISADGNPDGLSPLCFYLYVNGQRVPNPEAMGSEPSAYPLRTLGENEYLVIGDNRGNSHDSRANDVGPLERSYILGKVRQVIWPLSSWRSVE